MRPLNGMKWCTCKVVSLWYKWEEWKQTKYTISPLPISVSVLKIYTKLKLRKVVIFRFIMSCRVWSRWQRHVTNLHSGDTRRGINKRCTLYSREYFQKHYRTKKIHILLNLKLQIIPGLRTYLAHFLTKPSLSLVFRTVTSSKVIRIKYCQGMIDNRQMAIKFLKSFYFR